MNIVCIVAYFVICGLMMGAKFSAEPQFVLTSLRLFVNENCPRSHRAPCADTKHEKSEIHHICAWDGIKFKYITQKWHICDFWSGCKSRDFCRAEIFFDKSQIVCQGKLSEIPQSTWC